MSIVSEFKLPIPTEAAGQIVTYAVSHSTSAPVVAVGLSRKVVFFGENGQISEFSIAK